MNYTAAIPAFRSAATLPTVIASLRASDPPPHEIIVIDDASADASPAVAERAGARVVRLEQNMGRGAARARATKEATTPLLLMCDDTLAPAADFAARALARLADAQVAAAFGHVTQGEPLTVADRWRGRHLFKTGPVQIHDRATLATGVCLLRCSAVKDAGGFDPGLRSGEDADLGRRLLAGGWKVISDPALHARSLRQDSVPALLARYARWNSPQGLKGRDWLRQMSYAVKVMIREDLRAGDPAAALLSLVAPFFQFRRR